MDLHDDGTARPPPADADWTDRSESRVEDNAPRIASPRRTERRTQISQISQIYTEGTLAPRQIRGICEI
jgi:hypothetical protein